MDQPHAAIPAFSPSVVGPCPGASISRHDIPAHDVTDHVAPHFSIDIHVGHPYHLEWKWGKSYQRTWMVPGAICIMPAHEPLSMRWRERLEVLSVHLDPSILHRTAQEMKLRGSFELPERHGDVDPQVHGIAEALWAEAQAGYPTGRIFGESLITALTVRVLQNYSTQNATARGENRLSPRALRAVRSYVEEHLDADLGLADMAEVAGLSPFHFARCFKESTGTTPHQYVITRRIERAHAMLTSSGLSLAQVAAHCGFSDQSHLSRQFKRTYGVTPASLQGSRQIGRKNLQ